MKIPLGSDQIVAVALNGAQKSDVIETMNHRLSPSFLLDDQIDALREAQLQEKSIEVWIEVSEDPGVPR